VGGGVRRPASGCWAGPGAPRRRGACAGRGAGGAVEARPLAALRRMDGSGSWRGAGRGAARSGMLGVTPLRRAAPRRAAPRPGRPSSRFAPTHPLG
jgi:hypothetical protein